MRFEPVALEMPSDAITQMAFIPGTMEMLVLAKAGLVTHYSLDSATAEATRLGEFQLSGIHDDRDCGLISVAFDPDYATNHFIYFGTCDSGDFSRITRHVFAPPDYQEVVDSTTLVIRVGATEAVRPWHNVGSIGFDADGMMWALFGDKVLYKPAQDPSTHLGKVLRIDPDRGAAGGYHPVASNPFAGSKGPEADIVAFGLRSPWRGSLDEAGRLWVGDVGLNSFEEVNISRLQGENFGWPDAEGPCAGCDETRSDPVVWWDRSSDNRYAQEDPQTAAESRRVVWVGQAYPRDIAIDRYDGRWFDRMVVGDFCTGWIRGIGLDDSDQVIYDQAAGHLENVSSWAVANDGYAYATTYGTCNNIPYETGSLFRAVLADE